LNKISKLAGETALYGLGNILPRMLNFLLVPLQTIDLFSREEYGSITKLLAFAGVLNTIFAFGMETAFFRFATKPGADSQRIFNLAQTFVTGISVAASLVFIFCSSSLANYFEIGNQPQIIVWLSLILLTDALVAIPFARLRLEKKALRFASYKIINVLILVGLNVYFLKMAYDPAINIGYVFLANLIANAFYLLFFLKTLVSWRPAFDREVSSSMFRYAYPIMVTGVAGMINEMFSRITLDWWLPQNFYGSISNKEAVGIFGACYKYAVLMNLGVQAFRYAAEPFFFSHAADKNSPALFAKVNHFFILAGCLVFIGVSLNLDLLKYFIGEEFWPGLNIVPILLLAYLFLGIYYNVSVWFKLVDKTHFGTIITLAGLLVTLAANYWLIPIAGYTGSSWAALLCYFSMTVLCYVLGQRNYPIPYQITSALVYLIFAIGLVQVSQLVIIPNQLLATAFHILVIVFFTGIAYLFERKNFAQGT
jgi:O-antigen/teichoic acid export membrane protein